MFLRGRSRGGSLGSNEPPFSPNSFNLLFLCYFRECLSLSKSCLNNSLSRACSGPIFVPAELRVGTTMSAKCGCGHFQFFCSLIAHFCKWTPLLILLDPPPFLGPIHYCCFATLPQLVPYLSCGYGPTLRTCLIVVQSILYCTPCVLSRSTIVLLT